MPIGGIKRLAGCIMKSVRLASSNDASGLYKLRVHPGDDDAGNNGKHEIRIYGHFEQLANC